MNDDEQKALNQEAEEINSRDATPVSEEQAPEDAPEPETEPTGEVEEEAAETVEESPKKGYQARVQELNQKAKQAEEKAKSLEEKLAELTRPAEPEEGKLPQPQFNPQEPIVAPGEEIDVTELNRRVAEREQKLMGNTDALITLRQKQADAINRINSEANEVIGKYPELNPEHENFNQELSETITEAVEAYVKADPYNASVKKFVGKLMKPYQGAVDKEVGKATENIAKQVSASALRPSSIRKPEKSAREKTLEELEDELGIVNS